MIGLLTGVNFIRKYFTDANVRLANLEEEVQLHDTDITNLDETMTNLQISMSDLEDTVDSAEDSLTALETENDEMEQRLTLLEETVIGMLIYSLLGSCGCLLKQSKLNLYLTDIVCIFTLPKKYILITTFLRNSIAVPWVACASSPCDNEGSCIDVNVDTFICMCRDGYFGETCQYGKRPPKQKLL